LKGPVPEEEYTIPLGKAEVKRPGSDITLITWSKNVFLTLQVAEELAKDGISAEVIDLRTLRPLDEETVFNSVAKTHRAVIIQEQYQMGSYGAYVSHRISLVSALDAPMPYSKALEVVVLPSKERCLEACRKLLG
jgi:pyruvate dehydrogenase E1 component beta subunit